MARIDLLSSLDEPGTHSNSVPPCYKIASFRPDRARLAFFDEDSVNRFLASLSAYLGDAPLATLPYTFMGQPVYVRRGYPAPYLICGDHFRTFTSINPVAEVPNFWLEVQSLPFWEVDGSADDILLQVASHVMQVVYEVAGEALSLRLTGLHLCADVMADYASVYGGLSPEELSDYYISRLICAKSDLGERRTSHWFGRSKHVRWNVYDKTQEIADRGSDHYSDVWRSAGWTSDQPMTRVEVQLGADYFRSHAPALQGDVSVVPSEWLGSRVAVEAWYGYVSAIWADVSTKTRYTLADDSNRSRSTVHRFWQAVQLACVQLLDGAQVQRVNTSVMQAVDRDVKAMLGYGKSVAAKLRRPGFVPPLDDVLDLVRSEMTVALQAASETWNHVILDRVAQRAIPLAFVV